MSILKECPLEKIAGPTKALINGQVAIGNLVD